MDGENDASWRHKSLAEMTGPEWESLCDGCGRCCLIKLQDDDTDELFLTRLSCKLLDIGSCRCGDYANRRAKVSDCVAMTPANVTTLPWLPETCGYRLIAEGRELAWWHPLVSGSPETVHEAGISVRGLARPETQVKVKDFPKHIIGKINPQKNPEELEGVEATK